MEINKRQFNKWIKALRSGEYGQTTYCLEDRVGMCCLGVACDVLIPEKFKVRVDGYLDGTLPNEQPKAPEWIKEISENFQKITDIDLWRLNDNNYDENKSENYGKFSFDEIADLLEAVYVHKVIK